MRTSVLAIAVLGLAGCGHKDSGKPAEGGSNPAEGGSKPAEGDCNMALGDPSKLRANALARTDECRKGSIASTSIDSFAINPSTKRVPACEPVAVAVRNDGVWIATRADGRCFRARKAGELDLAWLETELKSALGANCAASAAIGAAADTKYAEVIAVMDVATKVGIVDIAVAPMNALPVKLDGDPTKAGEHCPAIVVAKEAAKPATEASLPRSSSGDALKKLPVVLVTRDEVIVGPTHVGSIAQLAKGKGTITALVAALPPSPEDHGIILQADQATDMQVIGRVIDTLEGAGYDNVMFAVKSK